MSAIAVYFAGAAGTGIACLGVIAYLRTHLRKLLIELCGTAERADFWLAFSNVTLFLVPMILALQLQPDTTHEVPSALFAANQIKWALAGLIISVLTMGVVLSAFIPRR